MAETGGQVSLQEAPGRGAGGAQARQQVGRVAWDDLADAIEHLGFGLVVWQEGIVSLANPAAAELVSLPLDQLIGSDVRDLFRPDHTLVSDLEDFSRGRLEAHQVRRELVTRGGDRLPVWITTRAIEVGNTRLGLSVIVREDQLGRLGRHPLRQWMDIVPVAVGTADAEWRIVRVSAELHELLGRLPDEVTGKSLVDWARPDDRQGLLRAAEEPLPRTFPRLPFRAADGTWKRLCLLVGRAPAPPPELVFALIGQVDDFLPTPSRVAELEMRLRRIGAEVRAAGLLSTMDALPSPDLPELDELSSRQWEITNRLARGQRVPTIARELYISQSTVRNHLSLIFRKFGVHGQAELVEPLRSAGRIDEPDG